MYYTYHMTQQFYCHGLPKGNESVCPHNDLDKNIHSSFVCNSQKFCACRASDSVKRGSGQWRGRLEVDYGRPDSPRSGVRAFSQKQWETVRSLLWTLFTLFYTPYLVPDKVCWNISPWHFFPSPVLYFSLFQISSFSPLQSAPNTAVDLIDLKYNQTQFGLCSAHNIPWLHI